MTRLYDRIPYPRRVWIPFLLAVLPLLPLLGAPPRAFASATCVTSGPSSGTYTVKVCITGPAAGATLTGDTPVSTTVTVTGDNPKIRSLSYTLSGHPLLVDYQSPYTFLLPTEKYADGNYALEAIASMRDGFTTALTSIPLTFATGNDGPPANTRQWSLGASAPAPGAPLVVAATGDGAGGETASTSVTDLMATWSPNLFLYLGDVYSDGTPTEMANWYGREGAFFSRFNAVAAPVVGNHEYEEPGAPGYFDYWDNIPHYYSYDIGGWHFVALDSTSQYGQVAPGTQQYEWLADDLASTTSPCTLVYMHHPLYTVGSEGTIGMADAPTRLSPLWSLLAQNRVTLLLAGHDHNYQRWKPLDATPYPDAAYDLNGMTELVIGTGGHSSQGFLASDSRVVAKSKSFGATKLELYGDRAQIAHVTTTGTIADSGTIGCKGVDKIPPAAPSMLEATLVSGSARLSWSPSSDNVGVTGYRVLRDGALLAAVPAEQTAYVDDTLTVNTAYTYAVEAVDAAGNVSDRSPSASVTLNDQDGTPPTSPSGVTASANTDAEVSLSWTASTDDVGVDHYTVLRDDVPVGTSVTTSFIDVGVASATTYVYTVTATDASGNTSAPSGPALVTSRDYDPPSAPEEPRASTSDGVVTLTWSPSTDDSGVTSYRVHRDGVQVGAVSAAVTSFTDTTVFANTTYSYTVSAQDAAGNVSASSVPVTITSGADDTTPPSVPGDTAAKAPTPGTVTVTWSASVDNVGVSGYAIYRDAALVGTVGAATTSFKDDTVLSETTYSYTVVAFDAVGNRSDASAPAVVTPPTPQPLAPVADSYVNAGSAASNYGSATALRVDADPTQRTYIAFNVSDVATIRRARLRLLATTKLPAGAALATASSDWGERTITYNTAPAPAAAVASTGPLGAPGWVTIDVSSAIRADGLVTFVVTNPSSTGAAFGSRESTSQPQLIVDR